MKEKYFELDQRITTQVMKEMKGQIIEHTCSYCNGKKYFECYNQDGSCTHIPCEDCNGKGIIKIQY